jgi:hypothetical protein
MKKYRLSIDIESNTDPGTWEPGEKLVLDNYKLYMYMDLEDLDDAIRQSYERR